MGGTQAHPPLALSRAPGPAALTCVTPLLAVAEALQGALGPGLGAHACGEAHINSSGDPALNPGHLGEERPAQSNPVTGLGVLAYLPEAGSWEAGREAEVTRCPSTRQPPSPRRGRGHSAPDTRGPPTPPSPLRATQGLRLAERVEPGPCAGRAGSDLGPGLTWAAARTFWYKLFPWRGSGGPAKTVGQMGEELSWAMPTTQPQSPHPTQVVSLGLAQPPLKPSAQPPQPSPWGLPKAEALPSQACGSCALTAPRCPLAHTSHTHSCEAATQPPEHQGHVNVPLLITA